MRVRELKSEFQESLKGAYPSEEIQSFFSILSEEYLGFTRIETVLNTDSILSEEKIAKFTEALKQIKNHKPIQYIVGKTEFYGLPFKVNENVLIPRPETEELVDWIVSDIKNQAEPFILDIGTGSGCISISIAQNLKSAKVSAIDISDGAIAVAKENAIQNKVNVEFLKEDILTCQQLSKQYDVIVSNPPYVRISEKPAMNNNVLEYEPDLALFVANNNPLLFYDKIADLAIRYLKQEGSLYFEINEYLGKEMKQLLKDKGFKDVVLKKDIFGKNRMIKCKK